MTKDPIYNQKTGMCVIEVRILFSLISVKGKIEHMVLFNFEVTKHIMQDIIVFCSIMLCFMLFANSQSNTT